MIWHNCSTTPAVEGIHGLKRVVRSGDLRGKGETKFRHFHPLGWSCCSMKSALYPASALKRSCRGHIYIVEVHSIIQVQTIQPMSISFSSSSSSLSYTPILSNLPDSSKILTVTQPDPLRMFRAVDIDIQIQPYTGSQAHHASLICPLIH